MYHFLDRSDLSGFADCRSMLDRWLQRMPPAKQNDIVARIRHNGPGSAQEERDFASAFFEMFLHEFLTGTGGAVTVEPQVGRQTPDFQVDGLNQLGQAFRYIVEAANVDSLRGTELEEQWNEAVALDALDEIKSPDFYLHVETSGQLRSTPPKRALQWPFRQLAQNIRTQRCGVPS